MLSVTLQMLFIENAHKKLHVFKMIEKTTALY